jgi:hypothetical protein
MAGLFPGICNSQNVDQNGAPLYNSVLTVYNGGTLVLASCFQDIALTIPAQNPMTADLTARLPIFYVADGVYRVRLVDRMGVLIYDYPQVASIGASSSGGGGGGVDPTTIFQTGDVMWLDVQGRRTGWVRDNGGTIGSATSGATERANADCQPLFLYGWANFGGGAGANVVGGAGASALADWAANKQLTLPDKRGCFVSGLDDMGNVAAGRYAGVPVVSGGVTAPGSVLGENTHVLTQPELPAVSPAFTGTNMTVAVTGGQVWGGNNAPAQAGGSAGPFAQANNFGNGSVNFTPAGTISALGTSTAHNNTPRAVLGTFFRKL